MVVVVAAALGCISARELPEKLLLPTEDLIIGEITCDRSCEEATWTCQFRRASSINDIQHIKSERKNQLKGVKKKRILTIVSFISCKNLSSLNTPSRIRSVFPREFASDPYVHSLSA